MNGGVHNMVYRRERPRIRKNIEQYLSNHHWSLHELKTYVDKNRHHFSSSFKTQLNKMLAEEQRKDFVDNLVYEMFSGDSFPVVFCDVEKGQWCFYCPWCHRKHRHSPTSGRRCSHCHSDGSPLKRGYILKLKRGV